LSPGRPRVPASTLRSLRPLRPLRPELHFSYGLRILRTAGLVHARKDGRVVFYRLATNFPEPLLEHCLRELVLPSRAVQGVGGEES
jgi:hypothetical protein